MKLIVCVDDKLGMMFNNRRQSKDRIVIEKIKSIVGNEPLYISDYSFSLFEEGTICSDFSKRDGYAFIENPDLLINDKIEEIYMFRWNRHYPSDKKFNIDLRNYDLVDTEEFVGYSHEKITLEKYEKRGNCYEK